MKFSKRVNLLIKTNQWQHALQNPYSSRLCKSDRRQLREFAKTYNNLFINF